MHHTAAFFLSTFANTANTVLPRVLDSYLSPTTNGFLMRENMQVIAACAMSATMLRARLVLPDVRSITTPWLLPVEVGAVPGDNPGVVDWRDNPFAVNYDEELTIEATGGSACAEDATAAVWLQTMFTPRPAGPIFTLRGSSTTTAVADTWTTLVTTWQDTPQRGRYGIVGLQVQSATARLARLIIQGQEMRPGALSVSAVANMSDKMFLNGGLGMWGIFTPPTMPQVEVLCGTTDSAHEVRLQFVPLFAR